MIPTSVNVNGYIIQQGDSVNHIIGNTEVGQMSATWSLLNNEFKITGIQTGLQNTITNIRTFVFRTLVTEEFTYTNFKYIQA